MANVVKLGKIAWQCACCGKPVVVSSRGSGAEGLVENIPTVAVFRKHVGVRSDVAEVEAFVYSVEESSKKHFPSARTKSRPLVKGGNIKYGAGKCRLVEKTYVFEFEIISKKMVGVDLETVGMVLDKCAGKSVSFNDIHALRMSAEDKSTRSVLMKKVQEGVIEDIAAAGKIKSALEEQEGIRKSFGRKPSKEMIAEKEKLIEVVEKRMPKLLEDKRNSGRGVKVAKMLLEKFEERVRRVTEVFVDSLVCSGEITKEGDRYVVPSVE
jgi:hypothetical protein